jgi:poly(A) polymerase
MIDYPNEQITALLLSNKNCKTLFEVFRGDGFEIRFVGGCVRDAILNKKSDDIDFATNALPNQMQNILKKNNIHYFDSGLKHGTITAVFDKTSYEITTLRHDKECNGRHAEVEYTNDWKLDASRRDFTFNGLYLDEKGKIYDYFGGISDLKNGILRFIGNPLERIQEDYLRILRAFRFYNRFCNQPLNSEIKQIIKDQCFNIEKLSGERIQSEIVKLFDDFNDKTIDVLKKMNELGVLRYVFLKDNINFNCLEHWDCDQLSSWEKLGILFRYNQINISQLNSRWHISNKNYNILKSTHDIKIESDFLIKKNKYFFLYREIFEIFLICCLIESFINQSQYNNLFFEFRSSVLEFPITAKILIENNFQGSEISKNLKKSLESWLNSNCTLTKEELLSILTPPTSLL